jgi:hypothetical protein
VLDEAVVAAAVAVVSVALVDETWTFKIGAPRLIAFCVSFVVRTFLTLSIPPFEESVF